MVVVVVQVVLESLLKAERPARRSRQLCHAVGPQGAAPQMDMTGMMQGFGGPGNGPGMPFMQPFGAA